MFFKFCTKNLVKHLHMKNCQTCSCCFLTEMFNHSLRNGVIPAEWKRAKVTPIYKGKGSKDDNSNYRPVYVISFIAKILETV